MRGESESTNSANREFGDLLELQLLETSARYLRASVSLRPLFIIGFALMLWRWQPIGLIVLWSIAAFAPWLLLVYLLDAFLRDETRSEKRHAWALLLSAAVFFSTLSLASAALFFWTENDRLNNVMLYAVTAAGMALAAGQSAPSKTLFVGSIAPYAVIFPSLFLIHESFPFSLMLTAVSAAFCVVVVMSAKAMQQLTSEMLLLREEKRDLIARLERTLADATAARRRAENASNAKSQFLANMSHELRTPLNAVLGFSEVIRDRMFGNTAMDRYSEYADSIHVSGSHLLGLINDILDVSKIEAGKLELQFERFDLAAHAAEALRFVEPQAKRKEVRLLCELPEEYQVVADKRALRQIAVNLLANAVKFTPPGGTVTLALASGSYGATILSVRDTGVGIRPEDRQHVLERFAQSRQDLAPADHGTGLGLAIAKSLAEAHGGQIALESEVGEGTTVTVTLPQVPDRATHAA